MDEEVDVVNEADEIIGSALKSECHRKNIWHRGAAVLVFRNDSLQEILIQKRSASVRASPGKYCLPGGHVGKGESYERAALRELYEEVLHKQKQNNQDITQLFKIKKISDNDYEFLTVYKTIHSGPFTPDPEEVKECCFWPINQAMQEIKAHPEKFTETTKTILEEYHCRCITKRE